MPYLLYSTWFVHIQGMYCYAHSPNTRHRYDDPYTQNSTYLPVPDSAKSSHPHRLASDTQVKAGMGWDGDGDGSDSGALGLTISSSVGTCTFTSCGFLSTSTSFCLGFCGYPSSASFPWYFSSSSTTALGSLGRCKSPISISAFDGTRCLDFASATSDGILNYGHGYDEGGTGPR